MSRAEDDVALTLVHTADWHLGKRFPGFPPEAEKELRRARLDVVDRIFAQAELEQADAVLCAGDLFDGPDPEPEWWKGLAAKLARTPGARPIFLLPGNHDPLLDGSVWDPAYGLRSLLPPHVHVVDRRDFRFTLAEGAVLHASPCMSKAGQEDLALALPAREPDDPRIRIGMVHGSTFDMADFQVNFPIAKDAAERRGFDYLAIGDTHSFRVVPPEAKIPTVYPSAPEPTNFGEADAGYVAVVLVKRSRRVMLEKRRVAAWEWERHELESMEALRTLAARSDLRKKVMRLTLDLRVPTVEYDEAQQLLDRLEGTSSAHPKVGVLLLDRSGLQLDTRDIEQLFKDQPEPIQLAVQKLKQRERGQEAETAQRALYHLYRLLRGVA